MQKNTVITAVVGLVVLAIIVIAVAKMQGDGDVRSTNNTDSSTSTSTSTNTNTQQEANTMSEELKVEDEVVGEGEEAVAGKKVTVHYTGTFTNGSKFDSSVDRGTPFSFTLGAGEVIAGWDQGVAGMKVGGKRKLTVPSDLAYGPNDYGSIPGGSTLLFDVELLAVE